MKLKYKCEVCGKEYSNVNAKNKHRRKIHPDFIPNIICTFCNKNCKTAAGKGIHERVCKLNPNRRPLLNNGNPNIKFIKQKSPYGTWKCKWCDVENIFNTRKELQNHLKEKHPERATSGGWNKGLTAETDIRVAKLKETLKEGYKSGRIIPSQKGKIHTENQKKLISESRKRYLLDHPDKVPYILNHHSKGDSYPERYFKHILNLNNIIFEQNYYQSGYFLDFAWPEYKIYFEVDGEQHYVDSRIVEHDKIRTEKLNNIGWRCIERIRWADYQKFTKSEKIEFINELIRK